MTVHQRTEIPRSKPDQITVKQLARLPVVCGCGWAGRRATGQPVTCQKCGAWAAFQWEE